MHADTNNPLGAVQKFLAQLIEEAERRRTGRHSLIDFATQVRRETAEEILRFVQSLDTGEPTRERIARRRGMPTGCHGRAEVGAGPEGERNQRPHDARS